MAGNWTRNPNSQVQLPTTTPLSHLEKFLNLKLKFCFNFVCIFLHMLILLHRVLDLWQSYNNSWCTEYQFYLTFVMLIILVQMSEYVWTCLCCLESKLLVMGDLSHFKYLLRSITFFGSSCGIISHWAAADDLRTVSCCSETTNNHVAQVLFHAAISYPV